MKLPVLLLLASLVGILVALTQPGFAGLIVLALPGALLSAKLLLGAIARRIKRARLARQHFIVVDGSNVMHWRDNTPQIETLREVVGRITTLGYTPGVMFDANAGYLLTGKYMHHHAIGRLIGLPTDRVMVVDRGAPADPTILTAARDLQARIVTNDRFRDWVEAFPEARNPGHLIRGGFQSGKLWLDLDLCVEGQLNTEVQSARMQGSPMPHD